MKTIKEALASYQQAKKNLADADSDERASPMGRVGSIDPDLYDDVDESAAELLDALRTNDAAEAYGVFTIYLQGRGNTHATWKKFERLIQPYLG